ncbi:MAG: hypothetical protein AB1405_01775 [Bdellovibrionota bacterium]
MSEQTFTQRLLDQVVLQGGSAVGSAYKASEGLLRKRLDATLANHYDDRTGTFIGGEMELLTQRNYEKALAHLWKAEAVAPYLGIHDSSKADKTALADGVTVGTVEGERNFPRDVHDMVSLATSEQVRKEFEEGYTPAQRNAVIEIMSLICHGEAYALYTSASLLPIVKGTGAKLGMAMQVMEEAKHFYTLRAMLNTLDHLRPLPTSARWLYESVARKKYYHKLFGMNVILESFATSLFSHFEDYPGLRHILRAFHMDESRHCAFPQTYAALGNIPEHVSNGADYQRARGLMLAPAVAVLFDYKPHFEALGLDVFEFFGKFIAKVTRLADRSGFPLPQKREDVLFGVNALFNNYVRLFEPENYKGFQDYTLLKEGEISEDMAARERDVFGSDVFGGIQHLLARMRVKKREERVAAAN